MKWRFPICRKPTDSQMHLQFPFCSGRCRLLNLGKWASGHYTVSEPASDEAAREKPDPNEAEH